MNDKDSFICNTFRALQHDPDQTAHWAAWPCNESDLHARHVWLKTQRDTLTARLEGDPDFYDVKIAGWWLWGISCWIGSGWCSPTEGGPWRVEGGQLVRTETGEDGIWRQRPHLRNAGMGVSRPTLAQGDGLRAWFAALQARLWRVRVCCGDWQRILGPSVTWKHGLTGILLDPPYAASEDRDEALYAVEDTEIAHAVQAWCLEHGKNPLLRVALCGYSTTHDVLLTHRDSFKGAVCLS